ncbi:MAG: hypothetical protein ABFD60_01575 [Bryobacteraceae bacterium]
MSTVTKTWSWDSTIDGWVSDGGGGYVTLSYDAGGDVGGCILCLVTGEPDSTHNFSTLLNSKTGETWADWGVPAGKVVTNIQISAWKRKVASPSALTSHKVASVSVTSSGVAVSSALLTNVTFPTSASAWAAQTAGSTQAVSSTYQALSTPVRLALVYSGTTGNGGGVNTYFDTISLTITYEDSGIPGAGHLVVAGHAPSLLLKPALRQWSWETGDIDGWRVDPSEAQSTLSYASPGAGGTGGCLKHHIVFTSGACTAYFSSANGTTWESFGVPHLAVVTSVRIVRWRHKVAVSGSTPSHSLGVYLHYADAVETELIAAQSLENVTHDWEDLNPTSLTAIPSAYQASNTQVYFRLKHISSGTAGSTVTDLLLDDVCFEITYTPGSYTLTPGAGHVSVTGHPLTLSISANGIFTPGAGHPAVVGYPPVLVFNSSVNVTPGMGRLALAGCAPSIAVTHHVAFTPGAGHNIVAGYVPAIDVSIPGFNIKVAGINRTSYIDQPSKVRVLDVRNATNPDVQFSVQVGNGWTPGYAESVFIVDGPEVFFSGQITQIKIARHGEGNALWYYDCTATGYRFLLTKTEPVFAHFRNTLVPAYTVQAVDVFAAIVAHLPSGFTANHVDISGTIAEISFDGVSVDTALRQLAQVLGASYYVDERKDIHFYVTADPGMPAPDLITEDNTRGITKIKDASQLITRQYVRGYSTTVADYNAGVLGVANGEGMEDTGAVVLDKTGLMLNYHDKLDFSAPPSTGVFITPAFSTPDAPYFGNRTILAVTRVQTVVTVVTLTVHGFAVGSTVKIVGCAVAAYNGTWTVTSATSSSFTFTIGSQPANATGGGYAILATSGPLGNNLGSYYYYAMSFVLGDGETALTPLGQITMPAVIAPPTSMGGATAVAGGNMAVGSYSYVMTFETAQGETAANSGWMGGATVSAGNSALSFVGLPRGADERVLRRKIYRTKVNGSGAYGPFYSCATLNDNTTTIWTDTVADSSLGADTAPTDDRSGFGAIQLTGLGVSALSNNATRRIYRYNGSGPYWLVGTITNNIDTTFCDKTSDSELRQKAPLVSSTPSMLILDAPAAVSPIVGDPASMLVRCDNLVAQAALAAIEGGTGIRCGVIIVDQTLSAAAAKVRGDAELKVRSVLENRLEGISLDPKIRAGQVVSVVANGTKLFAPGVAIPELAGLDSAVVGEFRVLSCEIMGYDLGPTAQITRKITASDSRFTPADLLAQWEATTNWRPIGYTGVAIY